MIEDTELYNSKHFPNVICSYFHCKYNYLCATVCGFVNMVMNLQVL
jgi:hypothetical protein